MSRGLFYKYLLPICLMLFTALQVIAQSESNPFDLQHRLPEQPIEPDTVAITADNPFDIESRQAPDSSTVSAPEIAIEPETQNPFDIKRVKSAVTSQASPKDVEPAIPVVKKKVPKPDDTRSGFLFWTILAMMIILALLVTLYRSIIGKIYRSFANENILKLLQREQGAFISIPYLFLYILFFINAGIFAFQAGFYFDGISFEFKNLMYCIFGVAAFFLLKHLILKIIEIVFPISKEIKQYSFTIIIFSIILGIILIPFNVFIAFAQDSLTYTGIITAFVAIIVVYLFRTLRGIFIGSKFLTFHKFHFFMYICTVEIAPFMILVKLIMNGASIH